jgi:glycosyl transferase, family 25
LKCLVINLDKSRERLAHMTAEFERIGVAFERVAAVEADACVTIAATLPHATAWPFRQLALSEVASFLSHRACWARAAASSDTHVAIFEDDAHFAKGGGTLLSRHDWIPADADIVRLETFLTKVRIGKRRIAVSPGYQIARLLSPDMGGAGYILSRAGAAKLLADTDGLLCAPDAALFHPAHTQSRPSIVYHLIPALCIQDTTLHPTSSAMPSLVEDDRSAEKDRGDLQAGPGADVRRHGLRARLGRIWRKLVLAIVSERVEGVPFGGNTA